VPSGAATLFQNVRIFDGKSAALSAPSDVLVRGHLIDEPTAKLLADKGIWWSLQPLTYDAEVRQKLPRHYERRHNLQKYAAQGDVWVGTRSGKNWKPASRFYGKTKEGEFMSELEALDRGYPGSQMGIAEAHNDATVEKL
jgi:hypothetical protein